MEINKMDSAIEKLIQQTESKNDAIRFNAFKGLLEITDDKVNWLNDVFDNLNNRLKSDNSYQRSIGMMLLCNLAKSDDDNRLRTALPDILSLLNDEKFITRRQCIQNIWKVAVSKNDLLPSIIKALTNKFKECVSEDHYNLLRQDIITTLSSINQNKPQAGILSQIKALIDIENNAALKKKYEKILKKKMLQ
jgi:hypothetical protein